MVGRLKKYHGYSDKSLSLAISNNGGFVSATMATPHNLRPRELRATRRLLRKETKVPHSAGSRISTAEANALRKLIRVARARGHTNEDMGNAVDYGPSSISTFLNDPKRTMTWVKYQGFLAYFRSHLADAEELITKAHKDLPLAQRELAPGDVPSDTTAPVSIPDVPDRTADQRIWSLVESPPKDSFPELITLLQRAHDMLERLLAPLPVEAGKVLRSLIGEPIRTAIEGATLPSNEVKDAH